MNCGSSWRSRHRRSGAVFAAWHQVDEGHERAPELYQLGEKLVDLEDAFRRWRCVHLATVSRIIGINPGTGGSSGLHYLRRAANQLIRLPLCPELWEVRDTMFSRERARLIGTIRLSRHCLNGRQQIGVIPGHGRGLRTLNL
jgi:hypothetical protein